MRTLTLAEATAMIPPEARDLLANGEVYTSGGTELVVLHLPGESSVADEVQHTD